MTPDDGARLAALRRELDGIDDALHDGLRRRANVVRALAASGAKRGIALRPGREAAILRRLCARDPASAEVTVRVWRQIFVASASLQGDLSIVLADIGLASLARAHFGALTPMRLDTPDGAIARVRAGGATAAVLAPGAGWLAGLRGASVIARLPFWGAADAYAVGPCAVSAAFVVGPSPPDPSGHDRGLIGGDGAERALRHAADAGFSAAVADAGVLDVAGLVADDDPRLEDLARRAGTPLRAVGGYACPIGPL